MDKPTALRLTMGFGGGMANTGQTCGAVSAAYMVLGLKHGFNPENPKEFKEKVNAQINEFTKKFIAKNGSTMCTDLVGYDLRSPEKLAEARATGIFAKKCPKFVRDAIEIVEGM